MGYIFKSNFKNKGWDMKETVVQGSRKSICITFLALRRWGGFCGC